MTKAAAYKGPRFQVHGTPVRDLCGWRPDDERTADFASQVRPLASVSPVLLQTERKDVHLWNALKQVHPSWRRGAQGIGDCVSWGAELCATMLMALQSVKGTSQFVAEGATEPIYGGCRVEALGKDRGGRSDGAFGASAAKWLRDWGCILRVDMSQETGISEHDLRSYSKTRAKDWGDYGCGGRNDRGKLDGAAREMPIQHVVQVTTVEECAAAIGNLYPVSIASMAGFGQMRRDSRGVCKRSGQWAHQMMIGGVRWRAGEPEFRIFQSWGDSCSGPDPGINDPAISACSWWSTAADVGWILRTGDCWCFGDIQGLPPQRLDLVYPASKWYQPNTQTYHTLAV